MGLWQRRLITDLVFEIDGLGWYQPEFRNSVAYRWSGPDNVATLRLAIPENTEGIIEIQILGVGVPPIQDNVSFFLNGQKLECTYESKGHLTLVYVSYTPEQLFGGSSGDLWIFCNEMFDEMSDGGVSRRLGLAVSSIAVEPRESHLGSAELFRRTQIDSVVGRFFLKEYASLSYSSVQLIDSKEAADLSVLRIRLENVSIGNVTVPAIALSLCRATESDYVDIHPEQQETVSGSDMDIMNTELYGFAKFRIDASMLVANFNSRMDVVSPVESVDLFNPFALGLLRELPDIVARVQRDNGAVPRVTLSIAWWLTLTLELRQGYEKRLLCLIPTNPDQFFRSIFDFNAKLFRIPVDKSLENTKDKQSEPKSLVRARVFYSRAQGGGYEHVQISISDWVGDDTRWQRLDYKIQLFKEDYWIELRGNDCSPPCLNPLFQNAVDEYGTFVRVRLPELAELKSTEFRDDRVKVGLWLDVAKSLAAVTNRHDLFSDLEEGISWVSRCWSELISVCSRE